MGRAEIFIVGDEILMGEITDKNGPWLLDKMAARGIPVEKLTVLPDDPDRMAEEIRRTIDRSIDYVLMTGGIGPTHDDRTREGVARGLDRPCTPHPKVTEWLNFYYKDRVNDARLRMANLPEESEAILLEETPAIAFRCGHVYVFPGIPELMRPLFEQWEDEFQPEESFRETVTIRAWEGDIAEPLEEIQEEFTAGTVGCYPHADGTLTLKVRGLDSAAVEATVRQLQEEFSEFLLSDSA